MSQPRDHHFIPVFYLKQWANEDGRLLEYFRPYAGKLVSKPVGPRATGFQRDLYSFQDCPKELAQYLESIFLKRADLEASMALTKLLGGDQAPWTPKLRSAWSRFAINFLIRHPHPFAEIRAILHDNWLQPENVTQQEYEKLKRPEDPPLFDAWVRLQANHLADRIRMRLLQNAMDNEVLGGRVNAMNWNVLNLADARFSLLTSDWPLYRELNGERMLLALPISPSALFTATTHLDIFERLRRTRPDDVVREINTSVVSLARLYVYSADPAQQRFIANRMSSRMAPTPFFPSLDRDVRRAAV